MNYRRKIETIWIFRNKRFVSVLVSVFSFVMLFSVGSGFVLLNRLDQETPLGNLGQNDPFHSLGQMRRETLKLAILIASPPETVTSEDLALQLDLLESRVLILKQYIEERKVSPKLLNTLEDPYIAWQQIHQIREKIILKQLNNSEIAQLKQRLEDMELVLNSVTRDNEQYKRDRHYYLLGVRKKIVISFIVFYVFFVMLLMLFFFYGLQAAWEYNKTLSYLDLSEQRYKKIVDTAEESIWILDLMHNITFVNFKLIETLGYPELQLIDSSTFDLCPTQKDKTILADHFSTLIKEGAASQDIHLCTANGKSLWFYISSTIINLNNAGDRNILSLLTDITERKEIEKALKEANTRLSHQANFDELTQIANRRYFNHHIVKAWRQSYQQQLPISIVLADIDFFKKYNDFYGHLQGDICLFEIAQIISASAQREGDLAARYGGEEFVLIFPNTSQIEAMKIIENMQSEIQSLGVPHEKSLVSNIISLSIGIVTGIPHDEMTIEEALKLADNALYQAKGQGRNQYVTSKFKGNLNPDSSLNEGDN